MTELNPESAPVSETQIEELIASGSAGFNAHDPDRFLGVMADDAVIDHSAWPTPLRGRDAIRRFYVEFVWKAFPDMRLEREDGPFFHPRAPRVAIAWRVTGTHLGPLDPPGFAPTGRAVELPLREIAELRDGLIHRLNVQLDVAEMLRQLGILPAAHGQGERALAALQRLQAKATRRRK
jgi:uncharacterized protein (TIGR02246 family)